MFSESEMDSRWEVFFQIKNQIIGYEKTSSLISLLSDKALRLRHWDRILEYVRDANPNFTNNSIEVEKILSGITKGSNGVRGHNISGRQAIFLQKFP